MANGDNVAKFLLAVSSRERSILLSTGIIILFWLGVYFFESTLLNYIFQQILIKKPFSIYPLMIFPIFFVISIFCILAFSTLIDRTLKEKNWVTAFNHAWDENFELHCIFCGNYVHIERGFHGEFFTTCEKCNRTKKLMHDNGDYITLVNARNSVISKVKKWKISHGIVYDHNEGYYCGVCYSNLVINDNMIKCDLCKNKYEKMLLDEIQIELKEKSKILSIKTWLSKLSNWL